MNAAVVKSILENQFCLQSAGVKTRLCDVRQRFSHMCKHI